MRTKVYCMAERLGWEFTLVDWKVLFIVSKKFKQSFTMIGVAVIRCDNNAKRSHPLKQHIDLFGFSKLRIERGN